MDLTPASKNIFIIYHNVAIVGPQSVQALALAQAAKVDRKLYVGNLPTGITPSSVSLS